MFNITQKKRKTGPAGEVIFEVGEIAAAGAAEGQKNTFQSHAAAQVRLPAVSAGIPGVSQQPSPLEFGSFSNLANLFHAATQQRAPVIFAAFHVVGNPFHGATHLRSPMGFGSFSNRTNLFLAAAQQTAPIGVAGVHGGGNHFRGATQLTPPGVVGMPGGGNIFDASGMNSGGDHFPASTSGQQTAPPPMALAGIIGNLITPQRIPVPFEGLNGVANLVHENPHEPTPAGFTGIDGVGYVFHRITQQRTPVRITAGDGVAVHGNPPPHGSRHRRVALTMCDESEWDDGLTQLFRTIEVAPRNDYYRGESSNPAANENGYQSGESSNVSANGVPEHYFFLAERCLVCYKKFVPGDDIFLYMGEYAYCSPQCREMQMVYLLWIEDYVKKLRKQQQRRNHFTITGSSSACK